MPRIAAAVLAAALLAGCGDGYYDDAAVVTVGVGVSVPVGSSPVGGLALQLTRVGPEAVQVDWSSDPYARFFDVTRDGYLLATVASNTLIDASGVIGARHCYQVVGRDWRGVVVSASVVGCLTLF